MSMVVLRLPGKEFPDERSSESAGTLVHMRKFEHVSAICNKARPRLHGRLASKVVTGSRVAGLEVSQFDGSSAVSEDYRLSGEHSACLLCIGSSAQISALRKRLPNLYFSFYNISAASFDATA